MSVMSQEQKSLLLSTAFCFNQYQHYNEPGSQQVLSLLTPSLQVCMTDWPGILRDEQ